MTSALALALLAAIEPLGLVAFVGVLGSRGGRRNTRGFVVGWVVCAWVVALLAVGLSGRSREGRVTALISSAGLAQVVVGLAALAYRVVRQRRRSGVPERPEVASDEDDRLGPVGAALIAAALQGWPVVAAAIAAVLESTDATPARLLGSAVVVAVASSTYVAMHVLAGRAPERTAQWLGDLRTWIEAHRDRAIDLLLLGGGGYLVLHGVLVQIAK